MDNKHLYNLINKNMRRTFNPQVVEGYAYHVLNWRSVIKELSRCLKDTYDDVIPGLKFEGLTRVDRTTRIASRCRKIKSTNYLNHARNEYYYLAANYSYNGEKLPRVVFRVNFVKRFGETIINNTKYYISPVLADTGISIHKLGKNANTKGRREAFLWTQRAKLQVHQENTCIRVNGYIRTHRLIVMNLNQSNKAENQSKSSHYMHRKMDVPAIIYLLVNYGLRGAAKKYFGLDLIYDQGDRDYLEEKYPTSKYTFFQANPLPHKKLHYSQHANNDFAVILTKEQADDYIAYLFLTGVMYLVSWFPKMLTYDVLCNESTEVLPKGEEETCTLWKLIAGEAMYNLDAQPQLHIAKVDEHLKTSVELMINNITANELKSDDINVNDTYELIVYIIKNLDNTLLDKRINDLYSKKLSVMRYFIEDFTTAITRSSYALVSYYNTVLETNSTVDKKEIINRICNNRNKERSLTMQVFNNIHKNSGMFNTVQSAGDNAFFKITSAITPQSDSRKRPNTAGNKNRGKITDPKNFFDVSIMDIGRMCFQPKKDPTGAGEINPYIEVTPTGRFKLDPDMVWLSEETANHLQTNKDSLSSVNADDFLALAGEDELDISGFKD